MSYVIAIDIGGTFTDLVACDAETGAIAYTKSPTTYDNLGRAIFDCIAKAQVDIRRAEYVKHGTTLVINALLQRAGARTALVTTKGFRDVLEIGRGNRTIPFDLRFRRDPPLIPRDLRFEIEERIEASGEVSTPLSAPALVALTEQLAGAGVEAVAVSFLNAYINPEHEARAVEQLQALLPGVFVTSGSELSREWHEFERTATAAANAYVGPQVSKYIADFDRDLRAGGFPGSLLLMGSHGGVISAERGCRQPIALVESGPVGGCLGAAAYGQALGLDNLIAFDMGGTTAKCALIERGRFATQSIYYVGGPDKGFPIRGNVIDILEVGVGGGSIAWLDDRRRLAVGPRSAGSMPGPACYARGGIEPTVTDANLVLGRLDADHFLGGEMHLDAAAARDAVLDRIAAPLGLTGTDAARDAARGILTIADLTMTGIIKKVSIARGYDPRDFTLFCYGGGGPLHGSDLARELGLRRIIVPPEPGNFSAMGMLLASPRLDGVRTYVAVLDRQSLDAAAAIYVRLEEEAEGQLRREFGSGGIDFAREAEMRYRGQHHTITLALPTLDDPGQVRELFDREYLRRYGHNNSAAEVELVALRSLATLQLARPPLSGPTHKPAAHRTVDRIRPVYFLDAERFLETRIYDRYSLAPGFSATGPAVIEEYGSTTLVGPQDTFSIGTLGEIVIDCST